MQLSTVKGPSSHLHFFPNVRVFLQHVSAHGGRFRGQFESGMELHLAAASVTHLTCFPTFLMIYMVQTWVEQHASLGWVDFVSTLTCACDSGITIIFAQDVIFSAGDPSVVPFYQDKQCWKTPWLCSVCSPSYPVVSSEVWDEDTVRTAQGSDDFLGRLRIPMAQILQRGAELNQRLEDCTICDTENSPFRHLSSRECWISTCGFGWSFPGHQQGWATRKSMAGSRRAGRLSISWCSLGIRGALESIMS